MKMELRTELRQVKEPSDLSVKRSVESARGMLEAKAKYLLGCGKAAEASLFFDAADLMDSALTLVGMSGKER